MKHLFRATKLGWDKEQEGVWFDSDHYSEEEARAEFKPYHGTTQRGYDYTGYEYDGQKYLQFEDAMADYLKVTGQEPEEKNSKRKKRG